MAASDFLEIANFATATEADQTRSILEANGVSAFVDGANANTALSHIGTALGGVKVLVRASDAEIAVEIIAALADESDSSAEAWFCGECQEEVDAGFEVCWSCGRERAEVEQPFPNSVNDKKIELASEPRHAAEVETNDDAGYDQSNPYASPQTPADAETADDQPLEINQEAEAILLRAWRASIIGIGLFPFITHLYSMYLLIRAATLTTNFSPEGQKRFSRALAINVVAGCLFGIGFNAIFR